ncbi:MAG: GNAT family N-acetyltransferase [Pseudomonadota bacterium]
MDDTSEMRVDIRDLDESARGSWEELWAAYNAFYGRSGATALSSEVIDLTWARLLDPASSVCGFLAYRGGRAVGLAHVVFHPNLIQREPTCYLQDLFTTPNARGGGVASALVEAVCRLCREKGAIDVYWHTHESNETARRLYDRLARNTGFLVYRMKPLVH